MKTTRGRKDDVPPASAEPTFEQSLARLGEIVERLESGDLSLEASLALFEEGVALSRRAGEILTQAEGRIEALMRTPDGASATVPFHADDEDGDEE